MSIALQPCASCARHVAVGTCVCPFCGAEYVAKTHVPKNTTTRMALVAAAAASVLGTEACGATAEADYGAPCVNGSCAAFAEDGGSDGEGGADASDGGADAPRD